MLYRGCSKMSPANLVTRLRAIVSELYTTEKRGVQVLCRIPEPKSCCIAVCLGVRFTQAHYFSGPHMKNHPKPSAKKPQGDSRSQQPFTRQDFRQIVERAIHTPARKPSPKSH